ncbi:hypothetical protein ACFX11_027143 [Malus domestica]
MAFVTPGCRPARACPGIRGISGSGRVKLDPMNNSRTRIYCDHDRTEDPVQHEPLERDGRYNELIVQRYTDVQEPY